MLFRFLKFGEKFKIRRDLSFVYVNNQLNLQTTFIIFQVLYKKSDVVREAYIYILYDLRWLAWLKIKLVFCGLILL